MTMDNQKTGQLIKQLRKEKGMTQKELAALLHVTDRAVSKWERGVCAPDIATLEPLAQALGCSVLALITGEGEASQAVSGRGEEEGARQALAYSDRALRRKVGRVRRTWVCIAAACAALVLAACLLWFWRGGYFYILDRCVSPDGEKRATVYSRELDGSAFSRKEGTSLIVEHEDGAQWRVTYGDCVYRELWWAPDSQKYVLALEYDDGVHLALAWLERNAESNLNAYLTMGVEATELSKGGSAGEGAWPEINYQFLQWGRDSRSMLIYYAFEDAGGEGHDGYFWYNCVEGTVQAVLELSP